MKKAATIEFSWPLLGNASAAQFLAKSLENGQIANFYILVGPDDVGKTTAAQFFAAALLCEQSAVGGVLPCGQCAACKQNQVGAASTASGDFSSIHPDLHILKRDPDKKNIEVEAVREFIHSLEMSSFRNSYKIGIIKQAERLNESGFNSLLKSFEEPREKVVFILIAKSLDDLPKTVISRAQVLRFYPVKNELIYNYLIDKHGVSRSQANHYSRLALGRPALAVKFFEDEEFFENYNNRVRSFLGMYNQDINVKFKLVKNLLGEKTSGQETVRLAERAIEVWQGVTRDLMLIQAGQEDLVQHEVMMAELVRVSKTTSADKLVNFFAKLNEASVYLRANVNPKSVLENVALAI